MVGLKEAITWKYKGLKWVWAATLIIGIIATVWFVYASTAEYYAEPTATKVHEPITAKNVDITYLIFQVELEKQSEYAYPPVIICPEAWLDVDKASSLGLTIDALKYSLGYFDEFDELFRESNSTGKETFLEVYKKENFSSLDAYYKAIGIDIPGAKTMEEFAASDRTISICPSCVGQYPEKVFWNNGICYVFQLAPEPADYSLKSLKNQIILMKMADHTDGLIRPTSIWPVYAPRSLTLRYATGSMLILPTFTGNIIRAESQRFVRLDTREAPCVKKDKVDANYSSEACFVECLEEAYDRVFKCRLFLQTTSTSKALSPTDYCNFYDSFPMSFWERVEYIRLQHKAIAESSDGSKCMSKCPKPCDQTVYELSLRFQVNEANAPEPQKKAQDYDRSMNLTFFALQLEHEALYEGGVLTLTEVSTISFTSLVSNLGGALGLFVGGTMMTFIQVILFVVKYVLDRRPII